jgi:hypothetical protein
MESILISIVMAVICFICMYMTFYTAAIGTATGNLEPLGPRGVSFKPPSSRSPEAS